MPVGPTGGGTIRTLTPAAASSSVAKALGGRDQKRSFCPPAYQALDMPAPMMPWPTFSQYLPTERLANSLSSSPSFHHSLACSRKSR